MLQKTATKIAAAAFIVGQTEYVQALYEAKVFSGLKPYTIEEMRSRKIQTTIAEVERQTGLDFGVLKPFDAHGSLESTPPDALVQPTRGHTDLAPSPRWGHKSLSHAGFLMRSARRLRVPHQFAAQVLSGCIAILGRRRDWLDRQPGAADR